MKDAGDRHHMQKLEIEDGLKNDNNNDNDHTDILRVFVIGNYFPFIMSKIMHDDV